jgi:hypothetical protein
MWENLNKLSKTNQTPVIMAGVNTRRFIMETKHTPGPWVSTIATETTHKEIFIGPTDNITINPLCKLPLPNEFKPNQEANAKLIAAAPDLLEALQRLMACPAINLDSNEAEDIEAYRQATNAVTKAIFIGIQKATE